MAPATRTFGGGRYELVREIGHGGMGQVFEVRIVATGGRAALKTLRSTLAADPDYLERFRREAIAIGTLEHPHLVRCFDFGIDHDGTAFLVMDLVEGHSLLDEVDMNGPVDPDLAVRLGTQICGALEVAHAAGVVHRDLKPSNIVLTEGYDGGRVAKVVDFGVASIKSSGVYQRLTGSGEIIGTPNYMAPEQLDASRHVDARTDVYGVGATLFGILTGRPPYPGPSLVVIIEPLLRGQRPTLGELRPDLGVLADVIERAMSLRPEDRYASVCLLREALLDVHASAPIASPAKKWPLVAGIALAFALGSGVVLTVSSQDDVARLDPVLLDSRPDTAPSEVSPVAETVELPTMKPPMTSPVASMAPVVAMRRTEPSMMRVRRVLMGHQAMMSDAMSDTTRRWYDESWDNPPVITTTWMPDGSDPAPVTRLMRSRAVEMGACLRRVHAPASAFTIDCDFENVRGTLSVHSTSQPELRGGVNRPCIMALLRAAPSGHPAAGFTGPVRIRVRPEYPRAPTD